MWGQRLHVETEAQMSIFPTNILLATDGSEEASLAARTTVDLANKTNSEIHLVYVTIPLHEPSYYEDIYYYEGISIEDAIATEWREQQRSAQKLLDDQVDKIKAAGGSVAQTHHHTGKPDQQIVELAEEIGSGGDSDGKPWARWHKESPDGQRLRFGSPPRSLRGFGRAQRGSAGCSDGGSVRVLRLLWLRILVALTIFAVLTTLAYLLGLLT
jgi:nucleotide-binding universal stress UspA family protein